MRRRSVQELDVPLGEFRLVGKGWIVKPPSGKHARPASREKYSHQFDPQGSASQT